MSKDINSSEKRSGHPLSGGWGIFLFIILLGGAGAVVYKTLRSGIVEKPQGQAITFVCSETNKPFDYTMEEGEEEPVLSPFSEKKTGYRAEPCYWTKDGKRKEKPTWVVLNLRLGKSGDTKCPDCGHVVLGHNPRPGPEVPLAKESGGATKPGDKSH